MKNSFSLNISKPCSENFNQFSPTKNGGFCNSCTKEVVDFTNMNAVEISNYFKNNTAKNTCGQFKKEQLTTYTQTSTKKYSFISAIGFAVLSFFSFGNTHAQEADKSTQKNTIKSKKQENYFTIKGNVTDESGPLPGVNILLEGTTFGAETDFDGNFIFPKKLKKGDVLIFSFIGLESKKVIINGKNAASNISLKVNMKSDSCILLGKVAVKKVYSSKKKF
ncbi:MAG: carboxypeptidase-like regulatory domain-containing protein [Tenacibaculum sp.]